MNVAVAATPPLGCRSDPPQLGPVDAPAAEPGDQPIDVRFVHPETVCRAPAAPPRVSCPARSSGFVHGASRGEVTAWSWSVRTRRNLEMPVQRQRGRVGRPPLSPERQAPLPPGPASRRAAGVPTSTRAVTRSVGADEDNGDRLGEVDRGRSRPPRACEHRPALGEEPLPGGVVRVTDQRTLDLAGVVDPDVEAGTAVVAGGPRRPSGHPGLHHLFLRAPGPVVHGPSVTPLGPGAACPVKPSSPSSRPSGAATLGGSEEHRLSHPAAPNGSSRSASGTRPTGSSSDRVGSIETAVPSSATNRIPPGAAR